MKCHESSAKVKWESIWAETCHLALLTIHWNSVTWLSDWKRNFFLQFFGGAYYNIQNIKYSPVWIDLSWLELTFHKKQEIMTSSILPTYPRGTIAFAMNVKCFSVIGLSRPFQSFVGKNQCQYFWIKFEDFHFSRYVCLPNFTNSRRNENFCLYFPRHKEYHTKSSILRAAANNFMWYQG